VIPGLDLLLSPLNAGSAILLKTIRRVGVYRMPISHRIFNYLSVFPVRDHYYEPLFNPKHLRQPLADERDLPGIELSVPGQLALLS